MPIEGYKNITKVPLSEADAPQPSLTARVCRMPCASSTRALWTTRMSSRRFWWSDVGTDNLTLDRRYFSYAGDGAATLPLHPLFVPHRIVRCIQGLLLLSHAHAVCLDCPRRWRQRWPRCSGTSAVLIFLLLLPTRDLTRVLTRWGEHIRTLSMNHLEEINWYLYPNTKFDALSDLYGTPPFFSLSLLVFPASASLVGESGVPLINAPLRHVSVDILRLLSDRGL